MKVLIICDFFNMGGIQRLALDQAYGLADRGIRSEILVLSSKETAKTNSFEVTESSLIKKHKIKITYLPGSRKAQMFQLRSMLSSKCYDKIFAHSLRGGVLAWLLRGIHNYDIQITTVIHQLPTLSAPIQRYKRMFYAQFCDQLYIFSEAAKKDWLSNRKRSIFARVISSRRKVSLCRNGVYLPRLEHIVKYPKNSHGPKRLIFIGRLTAWKGLAIFMEVAKLEKFKELKSLLVSPIIPSNFLADSNIVNIEKLEYITGKSISQINFYPGDLLLYPVNFPGNFIEGVSINVLEMACLGVPSVISNGTETWPELVKLGLVHVVDWTKIDSVASKIEKDYNFISNNQISIARSIIDINKNLDIMLNDQKN